MSCLLQDPAQLRQHHGIVTSAGVDRSATVSLPPSAGYWRGSACSWWPVAVLCWGDTVTNRGYTVANRRAVGGHPYLCLGSAGLCRVVPGCVGVSWALPSCIRPTFYPNPGLHRGNSGYMWLHIPDTPRQATDHPGKIMFSIRDVSGWSGARSGIVWLGL